MWPTVIILAVAAFVAGITGGGHVVYTLTRQRPDGWVEHHTRVGYTLTWTITCFICVILLGIFG